MTSLPSGLLSWSRRGEPGPAPDGTSAEIREPEGELPEKTDAETAGSGERFEDYVCVEKTPLRTLLYSAGVLDLVLLFVIFPVCLIARRVWLTVPVMAAAFLVLCGLLTLTARMRQRRSRKRILEKVDAAQMQKEFEEALPNRSDTVRLGKNVLFSRGALRLIPYESIRRMQRVFPKSGKEEAGLLRLEVWYEGKLKKTDMKRRLLCFSLPDGRTMDEEGFEAFLTERRPGIQVGMPLID